MRGEQLTPLDESLLKRRMVREAHPDSKSNEGWEVELSCGHTVWCLVRPMNYTFCGTCLAKLSEQAHAYIEAQIRPEKPAA